AEDTAHPSDRRVDEHLCEAGVNESRRASRDRFRCSTKIDARRRARAGPHARPARWWGAALRPPPESENYDDAKHVESNGALTLKVMSLKVFPPSVRQSLSSDTEKA